MGAMMADFFTRLAERSMGLVTQVRPDSPPALAPALDGAALGENFFIDSALARPAPQAPSEPGPPAARAGAATVPPPEVQQRAKVAPLGEANTVRPTPLLNAQVQPGLSHFTIDDSSVVTTPAGAERQGHDARRVSPMLRRDDAAMPLPVDDAKPRTDAPMQRKNNASGAVEVALPTSPAPQWRPPAPPPAPTVQVTIGRVEVRAVTPPPQVQPRPAERRASARLSLDDYLRQRNEGRR